MTRSRTIALVVAAFAAGAALAYLALRSTAETPAAASAERKVLYWHDPMVAGSRFDKPGKSPYMDMDLVPVYADEAPAEGAGAVVTIRPEIINNLGVRTYQAQRTRLSRRTVTHGYLFRGAGSATYALVDIFDRDADWVRAGMPARLTFEALPGEVFSGQVARIEPDIGIGARTLKAEVVLTRGDARLKPNMFSDVIIEAPAGGNHLAIPREALIRTGTRTAVVLALGEGRFQPVDVVAGRELGDFIEIVRGLKEGETIVTSGQFLIDSEASLRASFGRMSANPEPGAPAQTTSPAATPAAHPHDAGGKQHD